MTEQSLRPAGVVAPTARRANPPFDILRFEVQYSAVHIFKLSKSQIPQYDSGTLYLHPRPPISQYDGNIVDKLQQIEGL